jgi:hypothetical protein
MMTNYTMEHMSFEIESYKTLRSEDSWDKALETNIDSICRLNRAGRVYMATDARNRHEQLRVLEAVNDDLDCIFIHLRENPLVSDQHELALSQSPEDRKRKRT